MSISAKGKWLAEKNRPPAGASWIWLTVDMLESEAWRALPRSARQVIDRVIVEHLHHSGKENGKLIVTYGDFDEYGVRRRSIPDAIQIAQALGFLDVVEPGRPILGGRRRPTKYGLAHLPRADGTPPSNRWSRLDKDSAQAALNGVRSQRALIRASNRELRVQRRGTGEDANIESEGVTAPKKRRRNGRARHSERGRKRSP